MTKDKYYHIFACAIISLIAAIIIGLLGASALVCFVAAFLCGVSAGAGKEYGDKVCNSNYWDWYDILADCIGSAIGSALPMIAYIL